jgi:hypothetical protein
MIECVITLFFFIKILNKMAYKKAINPAYRTRGLEDAIHLAYNAQTVIGPENVSTDSDYMAMGQLWLSFTEEREVTNLNNLQSDLLNRLVMTYLEGQSGGTGNHSRVGSPSQQEELSQLPLWEQYKLVCERSQILLNELYS